MNHKRVERIWKEEGLKVPKKQPKRRRLWLNDGSCIRLRPQHRDHVWSFRIVMDRTSEGRAFRMLTIVDEYSRESLAIAEEQERRETTDRLRKEILPQFRSLGVTSIEVAYSGYGDSGAIDGVQYRGPTGIRVDRAAIPTQLIEELERCAYSFLPAGFETGDGGQGTLTIDVQAAKVTITHETNYTASDSTTKEIAL